MNTLLTKLRFPALGLILSGLALACWPVFRWWVARMTDGSDDPLGVVALVAAGGFLWQRRRCLEIGNYGVWMALGLILTQGILPLPPMVRAGCLVVALALALRLPQRHAGIVLLLLLSLPVVASLQFYFGYPLRLVTAEISRFLLNLVGLETERIGTLLRWRDHEVGVDAACSGIKMLWATCFMAGALSARERLSWARTLRLFLTGLGLVIALNGVRSTLLFFPEAKLVLWPAWAHEGVGVVLFIMVAGSMVVLAQRLTQRGAPMAVATRAPLAPTTMLAWTCGVLVCALLAFYHQPADAKSSAQVKVDWPTIFDGEPLTPVPLSPAEERFAAHFPGQINVFTTATGRTVIFRHITKASREVHSTMDCLQASGYAVHPEPQWKDDQGRSWGQATVRGQGPIRHAREIIIDANGTTYTDPSAWFWPALLAPNTGPWTGITVLEQ